MNGDSGIPSQQGRHSPLTKRIRDLLQKIITEVKRNVNKSCSYITRTSISYFMIMHIL
jgi:hypothetical protein